MVNVSDHTKCISLNNQSWLARPTIIDLNPNEYGDPFYRICVPNKREDITVSVFNMITRMNPSKTLTKHISCKCKYKFDGRN